MVIILILLGILCFQAFGLFYKSSLTAECQAAIATTDQVIAQQADLINSMHSAYEDAVYDNPSVDNIYKQIFIANEMEFDALSVIAVQNAALLEVTTKCK